MPFFDHSTAAVIRAFATSRECAEIPEAAKTITLNSCSERNFRPISTTFSAEWMEKAGIPFRAIAFDLQAWDCYGYPWYSPPNSRSQKLSHPTQKDRWVREDFLPPGSEICQKLSGIGETYYIRWTFPKSRGVALQQSFLARHFNRMQSLYPTQLQLLATRSHDSAASAKKLREICRSLRGIC